MSYSLKKTLFPGIFLLLAASCANFEGAGELSSPKEVTVRITESSTTIPSSLAAICRGGAAIEATPSGDGCSFVRPGSASGVAQWFLVSPFVQGMMVPTGREFSFWINSTQYPESADGSESITSPLFSKGFNIQLDGTASVDSLKPMSGLANVTITGLKPAQIIHAASLIFEGCSPCGYVRIDPDTLGVSSTPYSGVVSVVFPDGVKAGADGSLTLRFNTVPDLDFKSGKVGLSLSCDSEYTLYSKSFNGPDFSFGPSDAVSGKAAVVLDFNSASLVNNLRSSASASIQASDGGSYIISTSVEGCVYESLGIFPNSISIEEGEYLEIPAIGSKEVTDCILLLAGNSWNGASLSLETADGRSMAVASASPEGKTGSIITLSKDNSFEDAGIFNLSGMRLRAVGGTVRICSMTLTLTDYVDPKGWEDGSISDTFNKLFEL